MNGLQVPQPSFRPLQVRHMKNVIGGNKGGRGQRARGLGDGEEQGEGEKDGKSGGEEEGEGRGDAPPMSSSIAPIPCHSFIRRLSAGRQGCHHVAITEAEALADAHALA